MKVTNSSLHGQPVKQLQTTTDRVAEAAVEFITGPLLENPHRVGKQLRPPLDGMHSARFGTNWRVLYEIDERHNTVTVLDIRSRGNAYRIG